MSETQIDNPRFEIEPAVDIVYEAVAPQININWNPQTDTGTVQFWVELEEYKNGVYQGRKPHKHWAMRPMSLRLQDVTMREYTVRMPDGSEMVVPPGLLGLLVKAAFNDLYAEKVLALPTMPNEVVPLEVAPPPAPRAPLEDDPLFEE